MHASASENADLFWALRGGGGNFGVVTSFEFQLHPLGPQVLAGLVVYPFDQAKQVLTRLSRVFDQRCRDDTTVWVVLRKAPPLPFLPTEVHGKEVVVLAVCCMRATRAGREALAAAPRLRQARSASTSASCPSPRWQQAFDPLLTPGARNYWKSHNFTA